MLLLALNILWLLFGGGLIAGALWLLAGVIMFLSIVGIPWGRAAFTIAAFSFWPFGMEAVSRRDLDGVEDIGTSPLGTLGNIVWFVLAGWWLALGHLIAGIALCVTLIGIPFGIAHFKLAGLSLAPIGKEIVPNAVAAEVRRRAAIGVVDQRRGA